jgi:hypothetical protein
MRKEIEVLAKASESVQVPLDWKREEVEVLAQGSESGQRPLDGMRNENEDLAKSHQGAHQLAYEATPWKSSRSGRPYRTLTIEGR